MPSTVEASGNALPASAPEKPGIPAECIVPLKELCTPAYRARACNVIQESVKDPSTLKGYFNGEFGTCGDFRYTRFGGGGEGFLNYFDKRGELKGVRVTYDFDPPPCFGKRHFGEPIECTREPGKWYRSKRRASAPRSAAP
jgi:hypothetical protein